jgi:RimJ/RimL family protein N-acetyltransferase
MRQALPDFETPRLVMRQYSAKDVQVCLDMDMDKDVMRYVAHVGPRVERERELKERVTRNFGPGLGVWSLFVKEDPDRFIGWVILIPLRDHHTIELGYRIKKDHWGNGYATEACRPVISHGFEVLGLSEITVVTDPENRASQNVLAKLGFEPAGQEFAYGQMLPIYYLKDPPPR